MIFSRKVREILREPDYSAIFPGTQLDPDSQGATAWKTVKGGGFTPAGVGGGITGKGAHILVVDDPIKNQEEADSILVRDNLESWFQSTAYTRLSPGGGVLIIETWWNDDDLAGRLQALARRDPTADQYEIVKYPALAEAYEFRNSETLEMRHEKEKPLIVAPWELMRSPGEALHPARYDADALVRIKANLSPRVWSALYQQNPVPDEGMYFKKEYFKYTTNPPDPVGCYIYTAWDWAVGTKTQNDWTVGATLLQDASDNLYVLEVLRFKGDTFIIAEAVVDVALRWGTIGGSTYTVGFEDGQIWKAIEPVVMKRFKERHVYPSYELLKPLTDKLARARPLQGRMQQGKVIFPEGMAWMKDVELELLRFPAGAHDDIVDALAWVAQLVVRKDPPKSFIPPPPISWRDKLSNSPSGSVSHMSA
jgi:predicted phage terminase large subunit-like protein